MHPDRRFATLLLAMLLLTSPPAVAQEEQPPRDTTRLENTHGLALFFLFIGIAPPLFLLMDPERADTSSPPGDFNYAAAYYSGGGGFTSDALRGWAHWGGVQILHHGFYGEWRVENFGTIAHVQFQTIRGGYLLRPNPQTEPQTAIGITFGYRAAQGAGAHSAVELGLPLLMRSDKGAGVRFEPSYVLWKKNVRWGYRFDVTIPLPRTPFAGGLAIEGKQIRPGTKYICVMTLQLGLQL